MAWGGGPAGARADRGRGSSAGGDPAGMGSPDPGRGAAGDQQSLLHALGDDDPAEVQAGTADRIRRLITEAGDDLRTKPEPREWSVLQCIGHPADAEMVMGTRYRFVLAQDEPEIIGYDQD